MSEDENSPPQQPPAAPPRPRNPVLLIPRLGNIQATVELRGDGVYRRPVVRFVKLVPTEVLKQDPSILSTYEIEEVATLRDLLDNILKHVYQIQTLAVPNAEDPPMPRPGVPQEKGPPPEPPSAPQPEPPPPAPAPRPVSKKGGRRRR